MDFFGNQRDYKEDRLQIFTLICDTDLVLRYVRVPASVRSQVTTRFPLRSCRDNQGPRTGDSGNDAIKEVPNGDQNAGSGDAAIKMLARQ